MGTPKFPVSKTAEGPKTPSEDPPYNPDAPVGECSKCGIKLYRIMNYSCSRDVCPVFGRTGTLNSALCMLVEGPEALGSWRSAGQEATKILAETIVGRK